MQINHILVPMVNVLSYNSKGLFFFLALLASARLAESIACMHNACKRAGTSDGPGGNILKTTSFIAVILFTSNFSFLHFQTYCIAVVLLY